MAPSDLANLLVYIILSWFMSWFKQEMIYQTGNALSILVVTSNKLINPLNHDNMI